jgi:hypothetical protein
LAVGVSALLGATAFWVAVRLSYISDPITAQGWLESLFAVAFVILGGSSLIHGEKKLPGDNGS